MLCTCITASTCECICIYIDTLAIYPPTPADSKGERARSFRLERRRHHHHHQRRQPQQQQRSARLPPTPPQNPSGWMCFLIFRGPGWKKRTIKLQDAFWISFWALVGGFLLFFLVRAKSHSTVIYSVFVPLACKKYFLQHAENCVNTSLFARH